MDCVCCPGACTTIIQQLDEHDSKARYRRGRAYLLLGMAKSAKDDFLFILKSPYSTREGVHAARLGLRDLRRVVSRSELETKATVRKGLSDGLFSGGRMRDDYVLRTSFSADLSSEVEDDRTLVDDDNDVEFRLPPLQKCEESLASPENHDEGDTGLSQLTVSQGTKSFSSYSVSTLEVRLLQAGSP